MKRMMLSAVLFSAVSGGVVMAENKNFFDFQTKSLDGKPLPMEKFAGKVVLVVNTASKCGYTGQYDGLEKLYQKYSKRDFTVIGFPSNEFGGQEPGSDEEIAKFCKIRYGVNFPMSTKVTVKGSDKIPLFQFLTSSGGEIKWNFEKFLIGKDGKVAHRYASAVTPSDKKLLADIEAQLNKK